MQHCLGCFDLLGFDELGSIMVYRVSVVWVYVHDLLHVWILKMFTDWAFQQP